MGGRYQAVPDWWSIHSLHDTYNVRCKNLVQSMPDQGYTWKLGMMIFFVAKHLKPGASYMDTIWEVMCGRKAAKSRFFWSHRRFSLSKMLCICSKGGPFYPELRDHYTWSLSHITSKPMFGKLKQLSSQKMQSSLGQSLEKRCLCRHN